MNYTPGKLFAECTHRYQVVADPTPEPAARQSPSELSAFMLNLIETRLLPALANFPEALAAYTETLGRVLHEHALARP